MALAAPIALLLALQAGSPPAAPRHHAKGNLAGLISTDDYPADALSRNEQGEVAVAITVDPMGRVSACVVTASSGSTSLDGKTCALLEERARLTPAQDRRGRPVADTVTQKVTWRIAPTDPAADAAATAYMLCAGQAAKTLATGPLTTETVVDRALASCPEQERSLLSAMAKSVPAGGPAAPEAARRRFRTVLADMVRMLRPPAIRAKAVSPANLAELFSTDDYPPEALRKDEQGTVGIWFTVDVTGRATRCTVARSSGSASLDAGTCSLLEQRARFTPARDSSGRAVPDIIVQTVTWRISGGGEEGSTDGAPPLAFQQWVRCLGTEARRLAAGGGGVEPVVDRAFSACTGDERAAAEAAGEPSPTGGVKTLPSSLRDSVRRTIVEMVQGIRTSGGG